MNLNNNINIEKINKIKNRFYAILDDYKKYYIDYYSNPSVEEYKNNFDLITQQLTENENELNELSISINKELSNSYTNFNLDISNDNSTLTQEELIHKLSDTLIASNKLINDKKELYNKQYIYNLELIIGILIIIRIIVNIRLQSKKE